MSLKVQSEQTYAINNEVCSRIQPYWSICPPCSTCITWDSQKYLKLKKETCQTSFFTFVIPQLFLPGVMKFAFPVPSNASGCARWRPQIFAKSLYSFTLWQRSFLFLIEKKNEAQDYTSLKKAFEILNECYAGGIENIINAFCME